MKSNNLQSQSISKINPRSRQEMEKYTVIGQASRQVYEALGKACTKHTEHQAHFCVKVEQADIQCDHGAQVSARVRFNMGYTHLQLAGCRDHSDLVWFAVDSTSGDEISQGRFAVNANAANAFTTSLKRQIEPTAAFKEKRVKKSVRFQTSVPIKNVTPPESCSTLADHLWSNDMVRKDFCDFLRRCLRNKYQAGECIGVLEHKSDFKNYVYPSSLDESHIRRQATTLRQIIPMMLSNQARGRISLYDRLQLAKTLAIAVLQYHATPWLNTYWHSDDVYFFADGFAPPSECLSLASPHLNVRVKGSCEQMTSGLRHMPQSVARNPLLFSLGVILLEIAYAASLKSLQTSTDFENGTRCRSTDFLAARRLAKSATSDMPGKYHKVVEKLVECDFGCGTDLEDPQLQAAYYSEVIYPLETLEQKLRDFMIAD